VHGMLREKVMSRSHLGAPGRIVTCPTR
jgi:hypothetical protein